MENKKVFDKFQGKVVSFSSDEETLAIANISIEELLGRSFIVGTIPNGGTTNDWAEGKVCGIAWDSVSDFIIFSSIEEYKIAMALSEVD
jgi:hypothetical protein